MSFANKVNATPFLQPAFNVGCLKDILSGYPAKGMRGETIICGGMHFSTGGTGEANSAKTGCNLHDGLVVIERYPPASLTCYDTESTLSRYRILKHARFVAPSRIVKAINPMGEEYEELENCQLVTKTEYTGDAFYAEFKKYGEERSKLKADYHETPFKDPKTGKAIRILAPDIAFIDSYSKFSTCATEAIQDKGNIGDSKQNTLFLKDGLVKTQMFNELPSIMAKNGLYFILTAQIIENKQLDPYKAPRETLSFLKNGLKIGYVPDAYRYGVHNLWFNFKMRPLINDRTKAPEYPRNADENTSAGDTDLQTVDFTNIRNKEGASGKIYTIIYSQSEGVKPTLSEFHHIRTEGFGVTNKQGTYTLDLYPEAKITRTTIRSIVEEDMKIANAIKLTSDLLQVRKEWRSLPADLLCDAKTLYEDIKAKGYDWDVLLQTRSYWTFDQYTHPIPFLSIMDLLYMRQGTYHPYWMEKKIKCN